MGGAERGPCLGITQLSLKAMEKIIKKENGGIMIELSQLMSEVKENNNEPPLIFLPILQQYHTIFSEPKEFPPSRQKDHAIILKEVGTNPVPLS